MSKDGICEIEQLNNPPRVRITFGCDNEALADETYAVLKAQLDQGQLNIQLTVGPSVRPDRGNGNNQTEYTGQ